MFEVAFCCLGCHSVSISVPPLILPVPQISVVQLCPWCLQNQKTMMMIKSKANVVSLFAEISGAFDVSVCRSQRQLLCSSSHPMSGIQLRDSLSSVSMIHAEFWVCTWRVKAAVCLSETSVIYSRVYHSTMRQMQYVERDQRIDTEAFFQVHTTYSASDRLLY